MAGAAAAAAAVGGGIYCATQGICGTDSEGTQAASARGSTSAAAPPAAAATPRRRGRFAKTAGMKQDKDGAIVGVFRKGSEWDKVPHTTCPPPLASARSSARGRDCRVPTPEGSALYAAHLTGDRVARFSLSSLSN